MAKILDYNNLLDAADDSALPDLAAHVAHAEKAMKSLAAALATHLRVAPVTAGDVSWKRGFGGLCASFHQSAAEPCPACLDAGDPDGDWHQARALPVGDGESEVKKTTYGEVRWSPGDVLSLRPAFTDEQARAFLERNESWMRDQLVEHGFAVMEDLLAYDGIPTRLPTGATRAMVVTAIARAIEGSEEYVSTLPIVDELFQSADILQDLRDAMPNAEFEEAFANLLALAHKGE